MRINQWLMMLCISVFVCRATAGSDVREGRALTFPSDYGSHADFRTEWWYLTGWLKTDGGESLGFQLTFFRTQTTVTADNSSSFTPRQLLIAHCALSDLHRGRLWQDQRIRRAGLGLAEAMPGDTHVWIDDWSLEHKSATYIAKILAEDFALNLSIRTTQQPMLNGKAGYSQKGPSPLSASYYYSIPHLQVAGNISRNGKSDTVRGEAWLDHEWSSQYLDGSATGWEWVGINLNDGGALMAFRIRDPQGESHWTGGTLRNANGTIQVFQPQDVEFQAKRTWISPRTGIQYPVQWRLRAGAREFDLKPLLDDQENDTRLSTGAVYWEGAVSASEAGKDTGRGYLELTGYGEPLRLR